jgi:putative inorganic carbon (HCO3(-)) transporter
MKLALAAAGVFVMWLAIVVSRRPKLVLLFAWVMALTYNRQYFSFEAVAGANGGQGPYWIPADIFFIPLLAGWVYEAAILKSMPRTRSVPVHALFVPFALVGVASALGAERPDWTLYESIRAAKVLLILLYVRANFGTQEWWTAAAAMTCAVAFEGGLGAVEVATQRSGLLGVLGLAGSPADEFPDEFRQEVFYGWRRATATMNHPPNLACYLVLTLPMVWGLALTAVHSRVRAAAAMAGTLGLIGLACTLSRWPWAIAAIQLLGLLMATAWLRLVPVQRALGLVCVTGFAAIVTLAPWSDFIADRINRDLDRSFEFRQNENRVALAVFADHPLVGVGLNNYSRYLFRYQSEMTWALASEDLAVRKLHVRFIAAPQNGFLLPLAETGLLGLAAFLFYLAGSIAVGLRAVQTVSGWGRGVVVGLTVGLLGVMAQQIVDYSIWTDPVLYTFALIVGMLAAAPALRDERAVRCTA